MSKQKGLIKLVGNIGGVSFYTSNGEYLARMAGGPTKERIQSDPNFARTRENNTEFGGAAKVGKALRTALSGVLQIMAGSRLAAQLTRIFKTINLKGAGVRGKRPITLSANKELLAGLDLNNKLSLTSVFTAPYTASINADRNEVTYEIPAFNPANFIVAPTGATHFKLIAAVGLVSDYVYDDGASTYEPTVAEQNSIGIVANDTVKPLDSNSSAITLTATIPGGVVTDAEVSVIACLGIEFYQQVGGTDYLLSQGNTMKVTNVF
ncbi:hypothetical protein [Tenacibaculum ascidiaceicola]